MFARIIRRDTGHSSVYDCSRVHFNKLTNEMTGNPKQEDFVMVDFEGRDGCVSVELDKRTCELYLMNNEGRTIDTYRWYLDLDEKTKKVN